MKLFFFVVGVRLYMSIFECKVEYIGQSLMLDVFMFLEMPLGTVLRKEIFSRWQGVQLLWKRGGGEEGTRGREERHFPKKMPEW